MATMFISHVILAYVSLALLLLRGVLSAQRKDWRQFKLLKIAPHLVDTLLLASGIALFVWFGATVQSWLVGKLFFLALYIVFAARAFSKTRPFSLKHFVLAVVSFMLMMLLATTK